VNLAEICNVDEVFNARQLDTSPFLELTKSLTLPYAGARLPWSMQVVSSHRLIR